jgi:biopolymer transport protein ExbB
MWEFIVDISQKSFYLIPTMVVLLVLTIAVIIERLYFFNRVVKAGESMEHDLRLVKYNDVANLHAVANHYEKTIQAAIVKAALVANTKDAESMDREIAESIMWYLPILDKNLWLIDTSVTLGPLLGLLGTIFGMIESFNILGVSGVGNPNGVTGGIAHALIATALGLSIAIVAVAFLNYFHKRLRLALHQIDLIKVMVINRFHGGNAAKAADLATPPGRSAPETGTSAARGR